MAGSYESRGDKTEGVMKTKVLEREYSEYDIDKDAWKADKPHGISGLMRLKNDTEFVEWSILSHMRWIDEWVLVVQPSQDHTLELAQEIAEDMKNVRVLEYPFNVKWLVPEVGEMDDNSILSPAHMTNWGLSHCNYSWTAKIEGDVIALPTFQHIRDLVDMRPDDPMYYGRVGLNVAGTGYTMVSKTNPRNAGWDEAVFPTNPRFHCIGNQKWETMNTIDYTNLMHCMGFSFMHMKRCKTGASPEDENEQWIEFKRAGVEEALRQYSANRGGYPGERGDNRQVIFDWRDRYAGTDR
jgi:hypothetical protein